MKELALTLDPVHLSA